MHLQSNCILMICMCTVKRLHSQRPSRYVRAHPIHAQLTTRLPPLCVRINTSILSTGLLPIIGEQPHLSADG
ncbi:hypothetical protein DFH09DRAFT_1155351 [Mycena vulgaris]|nr:hypothetical protein DFH09DRAFT_1155351 [Mycena vulgaris]